MPPLLVWMGREPRPYQTRRLKAGDVFEAASDGDALVFTTTGLARKKEAARNPEPVGANRGDLAREYQALAGRPADRRWRNPRLMYEIGKLKP